MGSSFLIQGSKFIAHLAPAESPDTAAAVLSVRQRRYPDASHHCWAYRVGRPEPLAERSSDAGEPSGTAGRPIADALRGAGLENVVCVVTRYFGGTKLGTGGLVRAYGDAAREAIAAARAFERTIVREVRLTFDHERTGVVYRVLDEFGLHLEEGRYDARAHGMVQVPASRVPVLQARLAELALTGVEIEVGGLSVR
ncbi:MAG TPA: YigZ family protein [Acidobacteriota bacterium]|nr:YigZ family protein [Acidobacteriota bacterium]